MFKVDSQNYMALLRMQVAVMTMQRAGTTLAQHDGIENLVDEAMSDLFSTMSETNANVKSTEELVA